MKAPHFLIVAMTILFFLTIGCESVKIYGPIESRPEGKEGTWVIAGRTFTVTDTTGLSEEHGPLVVGACAQIELKGIVVEEIESEESAKCRQYESAKIYGTIESRPEGKAGTWTIGGRSYEVKETTKLDEDDGPLVVGACAELELVRNVVMEMESEKRFKMFQINESFFLVNPMEHIPDHRPTWLLSFCRFPRIQ